MAERRDLPRLGEVIDACEYLYLARSGEWQEARTLAKLKKISFRPGLTSSVNWWSNHLAGTAEGLIAFGACRNKNEPGI